MECLLKFLLIYSLNKSLYDNLVSLIYYHFALAVVINLEFLTMWKQAMHGNYKWYSSYAVYIRYKIVLTKDKLFKILKIFYKY